MLKAIVLLALSMSVWAAEDHATVSVQRWQKKLVVTINHDQGWHTYWKNPGDAGIASKFQFSQDSKPVEPKAHEWPAPKRYIEAGDILTIGYSGKKHFFFDDIPAAFELKVGMLICKDICIPGEAKLLLGKTEEFMANRLIKPYPPLELKSAFEDLPAASALPSGFDYYLTRVKDQNLLTLHYSLKNFKGPKLPHELAFMTAFPQTPFGYKREKLFLQGDTLYGKTEIEWDGEYSEPPVALPASGQFPQAQSLKFLLNDPLSSKVKVVTLSLKDFSNAAPTLDEFYKKLPPFSENGKVVTAALSTEKTGTIFYYLLYAFLGGIILNLMPCVLPVISLKLFGLIKHKNYPQKKLISHNLSYTAGVISTFMTLGAVIVGIKMTGEEIGWGFQLQSPGFILIMMLILFVLSLNLFGLFEFITPGGSKLGSQELEEGFTGDFFSGVLTTILSTPCSAPFLGTALTFAFTTTTFNIFLMFFFIGLGLAFPFLLTAFFPKSLALFPRPGAWMEKLKYFLGLSLIVTVIWLYDVFVSLVNYEVISWKLNLLFALWFFAFFYAKKVSQRKVLQFLAFALPLTLTVYAIQNLELRPTGQEIVRADSQWKPWSEEKMEQEKGNLVFVDFTAEWCLTCKVNKKLVLETDSFIELTRKHNLVLYRADWTKRDDNITRFLKKFNVVGVPAYFIQKKNGEIVSLGETISVGKIEKYLN
ncbi:MAG TPA: thioredoxin family protein [Bacteriovoracaceae bacterium]|nr:thioredoxin family protein [Bacteriovoracaceae bacterium]